MQRASRQYRDRELRLRARAVKSTCKTLELSRPALAGRRRRWARGPAPRPSSASPRPPRTPKSSRSPNTATAWRCPPAAGTTRAPARSTPSARPISIRRRARRPAPPSRWCWRSASSPCRPTPARRPPSWRSATARRSSRRSWPRPCAASPTARRSRSTTPSRFSKTARVVYTADVTCPEIKFLALGERRATVQFVITPGLRYRLMARALDGGLREAQGSRRRVLRAASA